MHDVGHVDEEHPRGSLCGNHIGEQRLVLEGGKRFSKKLASREAPHHAGVAPDVRALHAHAALKDDAHAFDGASLHPDQIALLVRLGPCRKAPQHLVNLLRRHAPKEGRPGQELGIYTTHVAPPKKSRNVVNTT